MPPLPRQPGSRYFHTWRRRTRKLLAPSGRLRETALMLSRTQGQTPVHWETWLREVLDRKITPSIDELTAVDAVLARPLRTEDPASRMDLFP